MGLPRAATLRARGLASARGLGEGPEAQRTKPLAGAAARRAEALAPGAAQLADPKRARTSLPALLGPGLTCPSPPA